MIGSTAVTGTSAYVSLGALALPTPMSMVQVLMPKMATPTGMSSILTGTVPEIWMAGSMFGPFAGAMASM